MNDTIGVFDNERLIIYKLGLIESALESIKDQLIANDLRDRTERATINSRLDIHDQEIKDLQKHKNYSLGIFVVLTAVIVAGKELFFKWLNFH